MISVIVPVYNVETYLGKCLDSILAQTFTDFELICVDDGSTDRSGIICDEYAENDSRILVVHQENRGLAGARKAGLRAASGSFVAWVDADDWIEPDYFSQMVKAQQLSDADIVTANLYFDIQADSKKVTNLFPAGIYTPKEILPKLIYSGIFFEYGLQPHLVTKFMKREILEETQLSVDERICIGEDAAVVYPSVLKAQNILITDICSYHYVQRQEAVTKIEHKDELGPLLLLINHLECAFKQEGITDIMSPQLAQYQKYLMILRKISAFDQKILLPYGGIPYGSRIVIYGAGGVGRQIYRYAAESGLVEVVLWADRNADYYQRNKLSIKHPSAIGSLNNQYDYILIANISKRAADEIRDYLLSLHVPAQKIRWFSQEITGEYSWN